MGETSHTDSVYLLCARLGEMCDLSEASYPFIDSTRIQKVPTRSQALEVRNSVMR